MAAKNKFNIFKNRELLGIPAVFLILCLLIGIVFISVVYFQMETESQKRSIRKNAEMLAGLIEGKVFVRLNSVVGSLCTDRDFISLLKAEKSMSGDKIRLVLNVMASSVKIDLLYLMDEKGTVFASAVSDGISLEGENYSFRPYFKEASEEKNYIYSALGVTTEKRGIYCSRVLRVNGKRIVITAKMGTEEAEKIMANTKGIAVLVTPDGVIFASSTPDLVYKSVDISGYEKIQGPYDEKRFENIELSNVNWKFKGETFVYNGERYLYYAAPAGEKGWMLLAAEKESVKADLSPVFKTILALSGAGFIFILLFMFLSLKSVAKRKLAERHVVESEKHLRKILNSTQEGFWHVDKRGITVDINPAMCAMLGYKKEEVIGESAYLYLGDLMAELLKKYISTGKKSADTAPIRMDLTKKDGTLIPVIINPTPLLSDAGEFAGVFAMVSDVEELLKIEEALRQSEENYKEIFDSVNDAIFIHDLKDFHVVDVNRKMLEIYRCTKEQAFSEMMRAKHFDSEQRRKEFFLKAASGMPVVFEWYASTWDNQAFWAEVSLKRAVIGGQDRILAVVRNIDKRKEAEEQLKYMLDLQSLIVRISKDFINVPVSGIDGAIEGMLMDVSMFADAPRGVVMSYDSAGKTVNITHEWCESQELSLKEKIHNIPIGQMGAFWEYFAGKALPYAVIKRPSDYPADLNGRRDWIDRYGFSPALFVALKKDGRVNGLLAFYGEQGKNKNWPDELIMLLEIIGDITANILARKKSEEALIESERKFRDIAETTADWIWEMDADGIILYSNPQVHGLLGYSHEELEGRNAKDMLLTPEQWEKFEQSVSAYKNDKFITLEIIIKRKNGKEVFLENRILPFLHAGENKTIFRGVTRDITERKNNEQKILQAMADLKRSNKDLEEFAYVASHDLKEPLRMVSSYVKLLEKKYSDKLDADAHDYIGFASEGAQRMQRLISDLLMYSRLGRTDVEFMDINTADLVNDVVKSLEFRINEIGADIKIETQLPVMYAERTQIEQLFQNLIANALKFISDRKPEVRIGCSKKGDFYEFYVRDNGIGISADYYDKIFIIFQQLHTKDKYPGTGIGLSVCKKVVEHHGGNIRVESELGKGTAFYFTISALLKEKNNNGA